MTKKEFLTIKINKALKKHGCKIFVVVNLDVKDPDKLIIYTPNLNTVECIEKAIKKEFQNIKFEIQTM